MKRLLYILPLLMMSCGNKTVEPAASEDVCQVAFDADSAFEFVKKQCDFGPRTPASEAHRACGDWIVEKFKSYGLTVEEQTTTLKGWDGKSLPCRNIIATYAPDSTSNESLMLCAHWDSRPWADADKDETKHKTPVDAANDGASGVAVMLETARKLSELKPKVKIYFVCFDLEDYGAPDWAGVQTDGSDWALGSQYFAAQKPNFATQAILLDMVGGKGAKFCYEHYSASYAPELVAQVWGAAVTAGKEDWFQQTDGGMVNDDHIALNGAGTPTIDIIPYDPSNGFGPTWHTTQDTPDNISKETLAAVGQTLLQFIYEKK